MQYLRNLRLFSLLEFAGLFNWLWCVNDGILHLCSHAKSVSMKFRQKLNFTSKFPTENHFTTLRCKIKSLTRAPTLLHMVGLSFLLNLLLSGTSLPGGIAQVSSRGVIYPGVIVKGVNVPGHMYQGEIVPGLMSYIRSNHLWPLLPRTRVLFIRTLFSVHTAATREQTRRRRRLTLIHQRPDSE